jgi:hypothetical protein
VNFRIDKLGSLQNTSLDLRDFTVIIGPNNSNKTYLAYAIYSVFDSIIGRLFPLPLERIDERTVRLSVTDEFIKRVRRQVILKSDEAKTHLSEFFQDSSALIFSDASFSLEVSDSEIEKAFWRADYEIIQAFLSDTEIKQNVEAGHIDLSIVEHGDPTEQLSTDDKETLEELSLYASWPFVQELFYRPFALPAERNALILTYQTLTLERIKRFKEDRRAGLRRRLNSQQLESLRSQPEIVKAPLFPKPVEDFLDFLDELTINSRRYPSRDNQFSYLASVIENDLNNEAKTDFRDLEGGGAELYLKVAEGLGIDAHNASSSIKQLIGLILYLRYRARSGELLVIDEPEMNLHPTTQVKLLEILAVMSSLGVKVLLTTHSPYIMAHLNNLVAGKNVEGAKEMLYLHDERSFLDLDAVSAYEIKNGQLHSLKDNDFGIKWHEFSDVSISLQERLLELYGRKEIEA